MSSQLQLFESRQSTGWDVRVSRRARRLSVRVYPGGRVEVVVPPGAPASLVHKFVHTHRAWIDQRVADLSSAAPHAGETRPATIALQAIGRTVSLEYRSSARRGVVIETINAENRLILSGEVHSDGALSQALRIWLADVAHDELGVLLTRVAEQCGLRFERVQARCQRTRWGSCSASGTISLNVCLMFLDPAVVRYLMVHELCHTRHMNHSNRFWALVEAHEPNYKHLDRELVKGWRSVPGWVFG